MSSDLSVRIGEIELKNPLICGSGEQVMTVAGIRAALAAGAGAVIAKSTNESDAARQQLDRTDYVKLNEDWQIQAWDAPDNPHDHLFCRSGLTPHDAREWLTEIAKLDREAASQGSYVAASIIPADFEVALELARFANQLGIRILEVNIGAPHGSEAAKGAIMVEKDTDRVRTRVAQIRDSVGMTLWIKLTGMSEDPTALAQAAREGGADAVVMMGRSLGFLPDLDSLAPLLGTNAGYGGAWALPITCRWLVASRRLLGADAPLLGTNGARCGLDIARMMLSGASAVEMTSAIMTGGFTVITEAIAELDDYLDAKSLKADDIIGVAADRLQAYGDQSARPDYWKNFVPLETITEDSNE